MKTVRVRGRLVGPMRTELRVRGFTFEADEPAAAGGGNGAPTPMEILAGAVNACVTVTVRSIAAELGIRIPNVTTGSVAHLDTRGFHGTADVTPRFTDYTLTVDLATDASTERLQALQAETARRCPAFNLVRDAGVDVTVVWNRSGLDEGTHR